MTDTPPDMIVGGSGSQLYSVNSSNLTLMSQLVTQALNRTKPPDDGPRPYYEWEKALIGMFLTAVIILSIGGNILVCVAILTDRYVGCICYVED